MARKDFGQYCGLARALELVGEQWALLVVRELLAHPSRYTDLVSDLPGIPTNVLTARLKGLEEAGIVERQVAPTPQRGVLYALTPDGSDLRPVVLALAIWGNSHLGEKQETAFVPPSSLAMAFHATFNAARAAGVSASWQIRAGGAVLYVVINDGRLQTGVGPAPDGADLVIALGGDEVPTFEALVTALAAGNAELTGKLDLLELFVGIFAPPGVLAGA